MPAHPIGVCSSCLPLFSLFLLEGDGKEVLPQIEVGTDPQESLAHGDERCHMLNPVGIKVLKLDLVVIKQSPKKSMDGGGEPTLMEVRERDNIVIGRRRHILLVGQPPPLGGSPCVEKPAMDKAL